MNLTMPHIVFILFLIVDFLFRVILCIIFILRELNQNFLFEHLLSDLWGILSFLIILVLVILIAHQYFILQMFHTFLDYKNFLMVLVILFDFF